MRESERVDHAPRPASAFGAPSQAIRVEREQPSGGEERERRARGRCLSYKWHALPPTVPSHV